jgi:hypothetical protein
MALEDKRQNAPRQRLSEFSAWFNNNDYNPSLNNRFSLQFVTPNILRTGKYLGGNNYELGTIDNSNVLNYYADSVNLPSKQVTTASITNVGSSYNYATSSAFSQINVTFTMPRNHKTRMIFERWVQLMSSDANQYTDYYDDYVCPNLYIFKWERGGGPAFALPESFRKILEKLGIDISKVTRYRDDQLVGLYDIRNVFPYNIGSMSLTNEQAGILKMDVGFYYERYRFYGQNEFDDLGRAYGFGGGVSAENSLQYNQYNTAPKVGVLGGPSDTFAK